MTMLPSKSALLKSMCILHLVCLVWVFLAAASYFSSNASSPNVLWLQCARLQWLQRICNPKLQSASPTTEATQTPGAPSQWYPHPTHTTKKLLRETRLQKSTCEACKCTHRIVLADGFLKQNHLRVFTLPLPFSSLLCLARNI